MDGTGTYYGRGEGVSYIAQYSAKWPDWYRQEIEGVSSRTVSGGKAWVSGPDGAQNLTGARLEEQLKQARMAWAERLFPLTDKAYTLSAIDGVPVNGRPTVGIKASHPDGRDLKLFFDKETYLLAKTETKVLLPAHGTEPVLREVFYTDHRHFGGVRIPSQYKVYHDKKRIAEGETVDYKVFATLDPKLFEAPE